MLREQTNRGICLTRWLYLLDESLHVALLLETCCRIFTLKEWVIVAKNNHLKCNLCFLNVQMEKLIRYFNDTIPSLQDISHSKKQIIEHWYEINCDFSYISINVFIVIPLWINQWVILWSHTKVINQKTNQKVQNQDLCSCFRALIKKHYYTNVTHYRSRSLFLQCDWWLFACLMIWLFMHNMLELSDMELKKYWSNVSTLNCHVLVPWPNNNIIHNKKEFLPASHSSQILTIGHASSAVRYYYQN